jgi:hypothetical protein
VVFSRAVPPAARPSHRVHEIALQTNEYVERPAKGTRLAALFVAGSSLPPSTHTKTAVLDPMHCLAVVPAKSVAAL